MPAYSALDYYDADSLLTEEERMIRDTVRGFVDDEVIPVIEKHNREATFPMHLVPKLGELGLLGANLSGYGLPDLGAVAYGVIMRELERGDSGLRSFVSVQGALVMYPIHAFGSEEQKKKWLPRLHRAEAIGCFGLTEPDHGSDPGGMETRVAKTKSGWILNGSKAWITNGTIADVAVVWAKTEDGIRGFLVEKGAPGYSASDISGKFSLRASVTSELAFQDVKLGEDSLLPGTRGLKSPLMCLTQARYGIAWGAIGAAQAVYDTAVRYAKNRVQFGKPIASFQLVQQKIAFMVNEITKMQLLAIRLGRLKEEGKASPARVSLAKMNNVSMALDIARLGRDMLGANGTHDEYCIGRHMCNLEAVKTYEGTHDIHSLIVAEDVTGIAAFS
jgi:glutaryl-CoA dehydrogenase